MTVSNDAGVTCAQCDHDVGARTVTLKVAPRVVQKFCGDRCKELWLFDAYARLRSFLLLIRNNTRGRGSQIARTALYTDKPA